ncbi:MAG: hypothetical protein AUI97_05365 [Crenarchaeota archaeon 13_1_40CM_3_52_17]|nr:MAG: hypothetical protein AUI97_05365 [Crenarchaeota archaeon 13_1_40CM_3_52_17]
MSEANETVPVDSEELACGIKEGSTTVTKKNATRMAVALNPLVAPADESFLVLAWIKIFRRLTRKFHPKYDSKEGF